MLCNTLRADKLESSPAEKDRGILVDTKFSMSQQSAFTTEKANGIIDSTDSTVASRSREIILFLPSAVLWEVLCPGLVSPGQERYRATGVQQRTAKMIKGTGMFSCEERLRYLDLFSLEKRRLKVISTACTNTCRDSIKNRDRFLH